MDLLNDLPSYNKTNFSRYSQGKFRNFSAKTYVRVKSGDEQSQVIVMDSESLLLRELEKEKEYRKRISLKRGSGPSESSRDSKVPRTES